MIMLFGDSDFQLDQIKDLLFPAMEKKEKESVKRLDHQAVQISVQGQAGTEDQDRIESDFWREDRQVDKGFEALRFRLPFKAMPCA